MLSHPDQGAFFMVLQRKIFFLDNELPPCRWRMARSKPVPMIKSLICPSREVHDTYSLTNRSTSDSADSSSGSTSTRDLGDYSGEADEHQSVIGISDYSRRIEERVSVEMIEDHDLE